jgi:putative inorganic carbon (HCO3(-)) transporter
MIARQMIGSARSTWPTWRHHLDDLATHDAGMTAALIAALALYYLVPQPLLALPLLLVYAALAWLRLDLALCLLPLAFPYWYVPKPVTAHAVFPLSEIALGVCTGLALLRESPSLFSTGGRAELAARLRRTVARLVSTGRPYGWPLALGIAGFVVAGALGVVVARRPHEALRDFRWEIAEPLLYLLLVLMYVRGPRALRRLVWALLGSALVLAGLAALQIAVAHVTFAPLAQGNQLVPLVPGSDGAYRATAFIYGSGNSLAAYLERALPLALALALAPPLNGGLRRWERLAAGALCLAYLPALYWSASRGAWIAASVAVVVVVCFAMGRPWLLAALAALAAGVVALWQRHGLVAAALAGHNGSGTERTLVWLAAWHMIRDHPLLGIGLDQFLYYYSNLYTNHPYWITVLNGHPTIAWREPTLAQPHNLVLDLWLSTGLPGLLAFAVILVTFWARCLRLWRAQSQAGPASMTAKPGTQTGATEARPARDSAWAAAVAIGLGGSMVATVVHGMVDSAYFVPDLALTLWFSVAVLLVAEGARRVGRKSS